MTVSIFRRARGWLTGAAIAALGLASLPALAQSPAPGFQPVPVEGAPGFVPVTPSGAGATHSAKAQIDRRARAHANVDLQKTAKAENR